MLKLEDQLKNLPEEFTIIMEEIKDKKFEEVSSYILNEFNISDKINKLDEESKNGFINLLKAFYIFGFYSGVSYSISPYDYVKSLDIEKKEA